MFPFPSNGLAESSKRLSGRTPSPTSSDDLPSYNKKVRDVYEQRADNRTAQKWNLSRSRRVAVSPQIVAEEAPLAPNSPGQYLLGSPANSFMPINRSRQLTPAIRLQSPVLSDTFNFNDALGLTPTPRSLSRRRSMDAQER